MELKENQKSYTIKQITDLLSITRSEFKRQVKAGQFKGINRITGKLTGITDDTIYISEDGAALTIRHIKEKVFENV